jgi:DNA repair protein RadD
VNEKWLFEKADLDNWAKSSRPVEAYFTSVDYDIEDNQQIREPQLEAYTALYSYFAAGNKTAIVQIPVGCGKSGLAAIIPFGIARGRVLIVTPNLTIKKGLMESSRIAKSASGASVGS